MNVRLICQTNMASLEKAISDLDMKLNFIFKIISLKLT